MAGRDGGTLIRPYAVDSTTSVRERAFPTSDPNIFTSLFYKHFLEKKNVFLLVGAKTNTNDGISQLK